LLKDRLKSLLLGGKLAGDAPLVQSTPGSAASPSSTSLGAVEPSFLYSRHSHGLDQFFGQIQDQRGLLILDCAGASQANVGFITSLGHRLYSVDFLRTLDETFGDASGDTLPRQSEPQLIGSFLAQNLDFPEAHFDGLLVWDALEFLGQPLLKRVTDRFFRILKPGAHLLAFFHAEEKATVVPVYSYRISDAKTLALTPRGARKPVQLFNNRGIERLFHQFHSVKFFLARDHLREVIVTR